MNRSCPMTLAALTLLLACAPRPAEKPAVDSTKAVGTADTAAVRIASIDGFSTPESVIYDASQSVWFVSNINGNPSVKDNNGFISRLMKDGMIDSLHFVAGGSNGIKLNGPKGLTLVGDTLWVADIDAVRGFNSHTGAPVATVEVGKKAHFLNDMVAGPDGTLYVTDTGIEFDAKGNATHPGPDRVFAIKGRTLSIAAAGDWLERPNGITFDAATSRFVIVPFGGPHLLAWNPLSGKVDTLGTGPGSQDGVEFLNGRLLVTSWADSTVFAVGNGSTRKVITGVVSPADIGVDRSQSLVAVPLFTANRVEFWRVPGGM